MPDDPNGPNPVKLSKPFRLNDECLWYVREQLFRAIDMFMDHIDFDMKPWDIEDPVTGKREIYIEDKNILRRMYKLKNLAEKQAATQQPSKLNINSNNWNFGSPPPGLLNTKKKT
jgi:hypothetical protein